MKRIRVPIAFVLAGFSLGLVAGCANTGIRHVSADEFIRQARTVEQMNSASGTFYIGASPTRAYVERTGLYRIFRCHKAIVYWTELDGLPPDIKKQLKDGNLPWTPWQDRMKKQGDSNGVQLAPPQMTPNVGTEEG